MPLSIQLFSRLQNRTLGLRTREGMAIARTKGELLGKLPELSEKQPRDLARMHATAEFSISDLVEVFSA